MSRCTGGFGNKITVSFTSGVTKNVIVETGTKSDTGPGILTEINSILIVLSSITAITFGIINMSKIIDIISLNFLTDLLNNGEAERNGYVYVNDEFKLSTINNNFQQITVDNIVKPVDVIVKNEQKQISINILKPIVITTSNNVDKQRYVTE